MQEPFRNLGDRVTNVSNGSPWFGFPSHADWMLYLGRKGESDKAVDFVVEQVMADAVARRNQFGCPRVAADSLP